MTAKLDDITLNELCSLIKQKKIIVPFAKNRFSCMSLKAHESVEYVDLFQYKNIVEYSPPDRTISVQCGIKVKQLQEFLASKQQWVPLACANEQTSLLDLLLTGNAGPVEAAFGGLRRHILGLSFVLANGEIAKSGGKVVKNVSGYDLTRFLIGSYGYFAIPIQAHLRVYALPRDSLSIVIGNNDFSQLLKIAKRLLSNHISITYMDIVNRKLLNDDLAGEIFKTDSQFILALQTNADSNIERAIEATIQDLSTEEKVVFINITQQKMLLQHLTYASSDDQLSEQKNMIVDLLLSIEECVTFLQEKELSAFPLVYRPMSHRLRYCLSSEAEKNVVLNLLTKYAQKRSAPLTVAYSDDNYIRIISKLESYTENSDKAILDIKLRLKNELDPDNLFNPFVKL